MVDGNLVASQELTTLCGHTVRFHSGSGDEPATRLKGATIIALREAGYEGPLPDDEWTARDLIYKYGDLKRPPTDLQLTLIARLGPLAGFVGDREHVLDLCPTKWEAGCFLKELLAEIDGDWLCFL